MRAIARGRASFSHSSILVRTTFDQRYITTSRKSIPRKGAASVTRTGLVQDGLLPLYEQIKRVLLAEVRSSGPTPRRLGSDNALMLRFGVSRMTIRSAVDELVRLGLVARVQGKGTYVLAPQPVAVRLDGLQRFLQEWHEPHLHTEARILAFRTVAAPTTISRQLQIAAGTVVLHVRRLREADDGPVVLDDRYVAGWCMNGITRVEAAKQSLFLSIEEHSAIRTEAVEQTVTAAAASKTEAKLLELDPGSPVLERRVLFTTADHQPTLCGRSVYRGDRVQFQLRASRTE